MSVKHRPNRWQRLSRHLSDYYWGVYLIRCFFLLLSVAVGVAAAIILGSNPVGIILGAVLLMVYQSAMENFLKNWFRCQKITRTHYRESWSDGKKIKKAFKLLIQLWKYWKK